MSVLSQKNFLPWEKHLDSIANNGKRLQHPVTFYFYAIGFWQLSHKFHWYTTGLLRGYLCHLKTRVRAPVLPHTYADASREFSGQGKKNRILTHLGFEFSSSEVSRFSFLIGRADMLCFSPWCLRLNGMISDQMCSDCSNKQCRVLLLKMLLISALLALHLLPYQSDNKIMT